jgi:glycosyltransferase involved in cell wall biosynthesis
MNRALIREVARDPELDVTVAAPSYFHGDLRPIVMEPEPPGSPLRVVPVATHLSKYIHVFRYDGAALRALARDDQFDVVHCWEEPYVYAGYQIARAFRNNPARFCFRTDQNNVKHYPPPFNYFERRVLSQTQSWIASATLVHQAMLDKGYPRDTGRVINYSVDLADFHPIEELAKAALLQQSGLHPPVVGFMGRLTRAKGLDVLMKALEQVGGERPWSFLLLGSGEYKEKVLEWAASHGWSNRVVVKLVKHAEVPPYLACMDLLAAPSQTARNWREQFGRMIIEGFASGVPVIGSDSGEIPFVIGEAGRVVGETDVDGWAKTIAELLDYPEKRDQMKTAGLARAVRFSAVTIAQQYRDYFRWLAAQSRGMAPSAVPQTAMQ